MAKGRKTGGRRPGSPNKVTSEAKMVALAFLDRRTNEELDEMWTAAKAESPSKALGMWFGALEFVMPKLGRQEHTGEDGGPLEIVIRTEQAE